MDGYSFMDAHPHRIIANGWNVPEMFRLSPIPKRAFMCATHLIMVWSLLTWIATIKWNVLLWINWGWQFHIFVSSSFFVCLLNRHSCICGQQLNEASEHEEFVMRPLERYWHRVGRSVRDYGSPQSPVSVCVSCVVGGAKHTRISNGIEMHGRTYSLNEVVGAWRPMVSLTCCSWLRITENELEKKQRQTKMNWAKNRLCW